MLKRWLLCVICLAGTLLPAEEPAAEAGRKLIAAGYAGDAAYFKTHCRPGLSASDAEELVDQMRHATGLLGPLEEIAVVRSETHGKMDIVYFQLRFSRGLFRAHMFLNAKRQFSGYTGPVSRGAVPVTELTREQLLADYDAMIGMLREMMPHAPVWKAVYGIDVWENLARYRREITPQTGVVGFAGLLQRALLSCKGHHLWLGEPSQHASEAWFQKTYDGLIGAEDIALNAAVVGCMRYQVAPEPYPGRVPLFYWMVIIIRSGPLRLAVGNIRPC